MNKHQHQSSGAQPRRTIPVPRIVKAAHPVAKPDPSQPLKPANVMKAAHAQKHAPWLTTAKLSRTAVPRIP
jgi:hypothetical protein